MTTTQKKIRKSSFLRGDELIQGLYTAKGSPIGFTPINNDIPWLNADRMFALWSIGYCLGTMKHEAFTGKVMVGFKLNKTNNLVLQLFSKGFTVSVLDGTKTINGGIEFIELKNGLRIIWQKTLTCLMIESFIHETYELAKYAGSMKSNVLYFKEDGIIEETELISVDEVFSMCAMSGPYNTEADDNVMLSLFDAPEKLAVITTEIGKFIVLKSEKTDNEKKINDKLKKIKDAGIDIHDLDEISTEEILELRNRVSE